MANKYKYVKKSIELRRAWVNELKNKPCMDCGNTYPVYVMDFHHRDPKTKSFSVGRGSFRGSKASILKEVEKCDLICANCHRIRHYSGIE